MSGDAEEENYDGMPGLMSVSSSEDDGMPMYTDEDTSEESEEDESSDNDLAEQEEESEYDENEVDIMETLLIEAMREYRNQGSKLPPWTHDQEDNPSNDASRWNGSLKTNPILKMLRSYIGV